MNEAIDLAVEQRRSSLAAWSLEHLSLDGGDPETGDWDRTREEHNALLAADDPSVVAYIGPYSSAATAVSLPVTNRAGLLQLGPVATWPGLTRGGWEADEPGVYFPTGNRTFARLMAPDDAEAQAAARWSATRGVKSVLIFEDGSSYSAGLAQAFAKAAQSLDIRASRPELYDPSNPQTLAGSDAPSADLVFYAPSSVVNAVDFCRGLNSLALHPSSVIVSDTALNDQFLTAADDQAQGWHIMFNGAPGPGSSPVWQAFANSFRAAYGADPSQFAGNAYDATNLVLDALRAEGKRDRGAILARVLATRSYEGVTGDITFDANGDRDGGQLSVYGLSGSAFKLEQVISISP